MASRERPVDRAQRIGDASLLRLGHEIRAARAARGLSLAQVAAAVGISRAEASRIELGRAPRVPFIAIVRLAGAVGFDLSAKLYPGPATIRDGSQVALLDDFARHLHPSLRWDLEVPLPIQGDLRAWDGLVRGREWRFAVEAESSPRDGQALVRRIQLKFRDGDVDGVLLVLRDTRTTRDFLELAEPELRSFFTETTRGTLNALRRGARPLGNGIVIVARSRRGPGSGSRPTIQPNDIRVDRRVHG